MTDEILKKADVALMVKLTSDPGILDPREDAIDHYAVADRQQRFGSTIATLCKRVKPSAQKRLCKSFKGLHSTKSVYSARFLRFTITTQDHCLEISQLVPPAVACTKICVSSTRGGTEHGELCLNESLILF